MTRHWNHPRISRIGTHLRWQPRCHMELHCVRSSQAREEGQVVYHVSTMSSCKCAGLSQLPLFFVHTCRLAKLPHDSCSGLQDCKNRGAVRYKVRFASDVLTTNCVAASMNTFRHGNERCHRHHTTPNTLRPPPTLPSIRASFLTVPHVLHISLPPLYQPSV